MVLTGGGSGGFLALKDFGRTTTTGGGPGGPGGGLGKALSEDEVGRVITGESVNPGSAETA